MPVRVVRAQQQTGSDDCGLFAIANATAVCLGIDPRKCQFDQGAAKCFEEQ